MALGRNSVVKLDNAAGSLTAIQTYLRNFNSSLTHEPGDASTMGTKSAGRLSGIDDMDFDGDGLWLAAFDAILNAALGEQKSLEDSPEGTSSGAVKYSAEVIVTEYEIEIDFESEVTVSFGGSEMGAVTRGTH